MQIYRNRGATFEFGTHDWSAERERWVRLTEGLSFAALAELVISVSCLGNDLEEAVNLLRQLDEHTPSSSEFGGGPPAANGEAREEPAGVS